MSPEAASATDLRKHWKGVVHFISPLLVNFKLSNSRQQKYSTIIRKTVLRNTDWVNLWINLWKDVTKWCCYVSACFFKWVYTNPWPSLARIRRIPAYHVDYTTVTLQYIIIIIILLHRPIYRPNYGKKWKHLVMKLYITPNQWRLKDFFVGGAKGGLNSSEGVLKK